MAFEHPLGVKHVGSSRTIATRMLRHEDMNGSDRLFGGRLMEWIDDAAGIAARRHAGIAITTVAVDKLEFQYPAFLNDIVTIEAWVTHVERTSLEVRVDTYVEDTATGERRMINHAYLTEVCIDDEGKPTPVPYGLVANTPEEHEECAASRKRAELRKMRRAQGI
ncbi:MAG: acyl-CoA thioesterase [Coriobacteriales bacterium]|nr:acyl-CoA thioesterase [Coriobacteriales bacterium]